ncbi:bifunctional biotin--[acetyl-CoA-carboxylase] ligase/biotin operon repressor BirA [Gallaecimonas sp. GXIMD4217]|uniref:bifunctional biotin--[acetyl-CoA-carboxylase] ligase/biotin operon repressor BirA n=1 Tax=Gallaecimonas sp. GXIMD4217 TaxID=3131927 RepID=UPI00311B3D17
MKTLDPANRLLLRQLADGRFHSGEELGELLKLSRASISKRMAELRRLGLDIFSVKGKGYRLSKPLSLLDEEVLTASLGQEGNVSVFAEVSSTNDVIKELGARDGDLVIAEAQTAGRGRRGNTWHSPFGAHLYFSLQCRLDSNNAAVQGLSLVAGVVIARVLNEHCGDQIRLKWPNDLYAGGRKLGGILVELAGQANGPVNAIIGVGINVNMPDEIGSQVDQPWTDLSRLTGANVDRTALMVACGKALREAMATFAREGLEAFVADWNRLDQFRGQAVVLKSENSEQRGICCGIADDGALILENGEGLHRIYGGELSMRSYDSTFG